MGSAIKLQFSGKVPVIFFRENDSIVAYCPALELSTCGNDIKEAKKNFEECLKIYLTETIKNGTLEKDLLKLGWESKPKDLSFIPPQDDSHKFIPPHILKRMQIPFPISLQ